MVEMLGLVIAENDRDGDLTQRHYLDRILSE